LACRRYLYIITQNIDKRQISVSPPGLEHAIPESEQHQTDALDRAATGISNMCMYKEIFNVEEND
jgi:hypothetical protein